MLGCPLASSKDSICHKDDILNWLLFLSQVDCTSHLISDSLLEIRRSFECGCDWIPNKLGPISQNPFHAFKLQPCHLCWEGLSRAVECCWDHQLCLWACQHDGQVSDLTCSSKTVHSSLSEKDVLTGLLPLEQQHYFCLFIQLLFMWQETEKSRQKAIKLAKTEFASHESKANTIRTRASWNFHQIALYFKVWL